MATQVDDGERLPLAVKELGTCDLYPQVSCSLLRTILVQVDTLFFFN